MRIVRAVLVLAIVLPFFACSSSRIHTDFDHQADFGSYSTFAWYQTEETDGPTQGPSQIVDGRIRRAIAENLQAKGLSRAEPGEAARSFAARISEMRCGVKRPSPTFASARTMLRTM